MTFVPQRIMSLLCMQDAFLSIAQQHVCYARAVPCKQGSDLGQEGPWVPRYGVPNTPQKCPHFPGKIKPARARARYCLTS